MGLFLLLPTDARLLVVFLSSFIYSYMFTVTLLKKGNYLMHTECVHKVILKNYKQKERK